TSVEEFLKRFPRLAAAPEAAWELMKAEIRIRRERGETPPLEEYLQRFPAFAPQLRVFYGLEAPFGDNGPSFENSEATHSAILNSTEPTPQLQVTLGTHITQGPPDGHVPATHPAE